ncbi:MAG: EcsC family protein [Deltaproteobacteria bacterium]|nr:EcsC family protein [Deltaproteobacteria bacterium]
MKMNPEDIRRLRGAAELLENPGLAAKLTAVVGMPFEKAFDYLPAKWSRAVQTITRNSLRRALGVAVRTIGRGEKGGASRDTLHIFLAAASGGIGGAFGLPALAIELPVTTVIMFRSIADIARSEGEDVGRLETKLACLEVFALGGTSGGNNAAETGYYAVRALLARQVSEAAKYIVERGIAEEGAPALVRLIATVASRFGVTVSQKAAATAVPVIGAAGGALINAVFIDHFQNMARGHFVMRGLEKKYGAECVRMVYENAVKSNRNENEP